MNTIDRLPLSYENIIFHFISTTKINSMWIRNVNTVKVEGLLITVKK